MANREIILQAISDYGLKGKEEGDLDNRNRYTVSPNVNGRLDCLARQENEWRIQHKVPNGKEILLALERLQEGEEWESSWFSEVKTEWIHQDTALFYEDGFSIARK